MLKIVDYRCDKTNEIFERMTRMEDEVFCKCGGNAKRMISPVRCKLDYTFPGESLKWAKMHEREGKPGQTYG